MRALALTALLVGTPVLAAEVTGYVDTRTQLARVDTGSLIDTRDLPQVDELLEFNVQVKHGYAERGFVSGDLSLFARFAGSFVTADAEGNRVPVPDHDVPALRPLVSLNELYVSQDVRPELNLLAGKKRIVWGPGMAFNPTDLLNPLKDPTDPTFQRAGAYLARIEVPLESYAFTLLGSPAVLAQESGVPYRMLKDAAGYHYLLAARAYALVGNTDVNLMGFFSNLYGDGFENKPRVGLSLSRVFFDALEVHFEGLGQTGSSRTYLNSDCVADRLAAARCVMAGTPIAEASRLEDDRFTSHLLGGARYQFGDDSMLSVEYLYQSDGYTPSQFQDLVNGLAITSDARKAGIDLPISLTGQTDPGVPQKFTFAPTAQHYVFLTFQKPRIADDFTAQLVVVANAQDLSTLLSPSVAWSATEWLTLTATGFLPLPGPSALAATRPDTGAKVSEYSLFPIQYRGVLEARVFY